MPAEPATKPDRNRLPAPDREPEGPPDEEFWEKYNKRLEFPFAAVGAVLIHVTAAALLIFGFLRLMNSDGDRSGVPLTLVPEMDGQDETGAGKVGSGGMVDPLARADSNPWKAAEAFLPDPSKLPEIKDELRKEIALDDPNGTAPPISSANVAAYTDLEKTLRDKINGIGANKGAGSEGGQGDSGQKGTGAGGTGADSSRAKSLRWVLRFRTASGEDYVAQLAAMDAVILVPIPPENKQCYYFTDLKNPRAGRKIATDDDLRRLSGQIKFSDTRPDSVRGVCEVLGVKENARSFWAFFPKGIEADLTRKEIGYRNRRPEDIEETVFRVVVKGGSYEAVVDDQTPKR